MEPTQLEKLLEQFPELNRNATSPEEQEKYLKGYSWSALVYNVFYFFAMRDWLFVGISIVCSIVIYLIPVLFILPFFARRRAWEKRGWKDYAEFSETQKQWDRSSIYGIVVLVLVILIGGYLLSTLVKGFSASDLQNNVNQLQGL